MRIAKVASRTFRWFRAGMASLALIQLALGQGSSTSAPNDNRTVTPIKHVIVIIGENRSFDHVFATYQPPNGQSVWNLLSKGIINADGTPGTNFSQAAQQAATDSLPSDTFLLSPPKVAFPNSVLPAPLVGGPSDSTSPATACPWRSHPRMDCPPARSTTTT